MTIFGDIEGYRRSVAVTGKAIFTKDRKVFSGFGAFAGMMNKKTSRIRGPDCFVADSSQ